MTHFNLRGFISQHVSLHLVPHGFISHPRCQFYIVLHFNLRGLISQYRCQFYIVSHCNLRASIWQHMSVLRRVTLDPTWIYLTTHVSFTSCYTWSHVDLSHKTCQFYVVLHLIPRGFDWFWLRQCLWSADKERQRFKACGEIVRVQISVKTVCGLWWPGLTDGGWPPADPDCLQELNKQVTSTRPTWSTRHAWYLHVAIADMSPSVDFGVVGWGGGEYVCR